jgi:hypothetical protein
MSFYLYIILAYLLVLTVINFYGQKGKESGRFYGSWPQT